MRVAEKEKGVYMVDVGVGKYLRSPEMCRLENIFTSPPYSRTDSTSLTYSLRRFTS